MSQQEEINVNDPIQGLSVLRNLTEQMQFRPSDVRTLDMIFMTLQNEILEVQVLRGIVDKCGCRNEVQNKTEAETGD